VFHISLHYFYSNARLIVIAMPVNAVHLHSVLDIGVEVSSPKGRFAQRLLRFLIFFNMFLCFLPKYAKVFSAKYNQIGEPERFFSAKLFQNYEQQKFFPQNRKNFAVRLNRKHFLPLQYLKGRNFRGKKISQISRFWLKPQN